MEGSDFELWVNLWSMGEIKINLLTFEFLLLFWILGEFLTSMRTFEFWFNWDY